MLTIDPGPMERLHALVILAWALLRSIVTRLVGGRRNIDDFRRSYAADRLPPVTSEERERSAERSRCIACGLCDAGEGPAMAGSQGAYAGVMDLMLASSRSMPDHDAALRSFSAVSDERLAILEARCPARVPMRQIARLVRAKAAAMEESIESRESRR
jgi:succinate dehydrogenase/fumarate reductase-like Fe-S protein